MLLDSLDRSNHLLGRDAELELVISSLEDYRLVVITGGAGEGKTRLAQEVVERLQCRIALVSYVPVDIGECCPHQRWCAFACHWRSASSACCPAAWPAAPAPQPAAAQGALPSPAVSCWAWQQVGLVP